VTRNTPHHTQARPRVRPWSTDELPLPSSSSSQHGPRAPDAASASAKLAKAPNAMLHAALPSPSVAGHLGRDKSAGAGGGGGGRRRDSANTGTVWDFAPIGQEILTPIQQTGAGGHRGQWSEDERGSREGEKAVQRGAQGDEGGSGTGDACVPSGLGLEAPRFPNVRKDTWEKESDDGGGCEGAGRPQGQERSEPQLLKNVSL